MSRKEQKKKDKALKLQASVGAVSVVDNAGVRGLLEDPGHIRSDCQMIARYAHDFTDEELLKIRRRLGEIVITGSDRDAIAASRAEQTRVRLLHEMEMRKLEVQSGTQLHGHIHVGEGIPADSAGDRIAEILSRIRNPAVAAGTVVDSDSAERTVSDSPA